jgi:hypothetical protein
MISNPTGVPIGRTAIFLSALFYSLFSSLVRLPQARAQGEPKQRHCDIVVYGGTAGGVAAAVQGARMGKSVVLIEPGRHIGGLTSGGLGATDIGNKAAIGGIAREFYRRLGTHYANDASWKFQTRAEYKEGRQAAGEAEMWTFEPRVAEEMLRVMLAEAKVPVVFEKRLDLTKGVQRAGARIASITMEGGTIYAAKMFIDATYEGDLMAKAGVSYTVGREANAQYGETLNGVQTAQATKHQFLKAVDPYLTPGDPASGLLPGIHAGSPGRDGEGDKRVQTYNFRMCLTDAPANRIPFPKPAGYDPLRYELLLRYIQAGVFDAFCSNLPMPNRKSDCNNCGAFSTDNIGMNYDFPDGDYATRERIFQEHVVYQQGLMWFLANDPRVPQKVRDEIGRWGLCKDEFTETGGWPHQLYVREARRMIGAYVMTQHNCQGRAVADDPVGLAAYTMDSHNTQRYVKDGKAINEGDVQVGGFSPYPISYRSLVPQEAQCANLLVPVCLSATHIAYGSIRMEPVFMVLGQSAATAAAQAIDDDSAVQNVDYKKLQARLLADKQVLAWTGPVTRSRDPKNLRGLVVDDAQAELTGEWTASTAVGGYVGTGYRHDGNTEQGKKSARFTFKVERPGSYEVRVAYTPNANRATNVPMTVFSSEGEKTARVNEREKPGPDGFASLGSFRFDQSATVVISNAGADGYVVVDAVQIVAESPKWLYSTAYEIPKHTTSEGSGYFAIVEGKNRHIYIGAAKYGSNAYLVDFDPTTKKMSVAVDCMKEIGSTATGFAAQAKIHTRCNVGPSGKIYFATKQGYPKEGEQRSDYPGGYPMVYDPQTGRTRVYAIPVPHQGIISITPDESLNLAYISTCSDGRPIDSAHFMILNLESGTYRDLLDCQHMYAFIVVDQKGRAYHPIRGGEIARYDPTSDRLDRLKQTIDGEPPAAESHLVDPESHPINWDISPKRGTLWAVAMSGNALYSYDLTGDGETFAGKSHGPTIPTAKSTDCRAMCVGPDGTVWMGVAANTDQQYLHLASYKPGAAGCVDHGPIGVSNPSFTQFKDQDGKDLPWHNGFYTHADGTLVPRYTIMGICAAVDGTVYVTTLSPFTLHAIRVK